MNGQLPGSPITSQKGTRPVYFVRRTASRGANKEAARGKAAVLTKRTVPATTAALATHGAPPPGNLLWLCWEGGHVLLSCTFSIGVAKMFDLRTKIMIGIGISLLVAAIVLLCVVLCLYFKIAKALKAAKESGHNSDKVLDTKNSQAKTIAMESCPAQQCCEGCRMYANFDSLPPCCCDVHEGL
ncbi:protein FAM24A-like [Sapajus apella]|uniref:Protein FAM24A-like n=1 Tax=Sapajus apella TaxID=9515 RepID=A0A6J3I3B4_SAPAP|nr:protein FAM24A-like [Sapajus apella]